MTQPTPNEPVTFSTFAKGLTGETAFDVLAVARKLKAAGKDVIELQIGDSPFASTKHALAGGIRAIETGATHYCPSPGLPSFREAAARNYQREFGVSVGPENVVVAPGAKVFEQFFCEAFLEPDDAVLVFTPHFPTYGPNIARRGARLVFSPLRQENQFRPDLNDVEHFVNKAPRAKAIFLNSPHNPTGGVATTDDLRGLADIVRGKNIAVFSDEPYCHMVWQGRHATPLAQPGMLEQCMAVYTFSKSYSMSGWRLGYAVCGKRLAETVAKMLNTSLSCTPPIVQLAGQAALENDAGERDEVMARFKTKVELLVSELRKLPDVTVLMPPGTQSHGLAMYLLEAADDRLGVACLGGECFGPAGAGFLRFSCAEPDQRLREAVAFLAEAVKRIDRVRKYLETHPRYRLV
jgi:aspartate aminotransferase